MSNPVRVLCQVECQLTLYPRPMKWEIQPIPTGDQLQPKTILEYDNPALPAPPSLPILVTTTSVTATRRTTIAMPSLAAFTTMTTITKNIIKQLLSREMQTLIITDAESALQPMMTKSSITH